jgi:hypothetical protein
MFHFSRKLFIVVLAGWALKVILVPLPPLRSDFLAWVGIAQNIFTLMSIGKLPSLSIFGVYTGMGTLLTPFYWLWTLLPIQHMPIAEMIAHQSLARISMMYVMKLPILISDFFAGLFIFLLAQKVNPSKARNALLSWHLNPFNIYFLYWHTTMDVIPAVFVLVAIHYGMKRNWAGCTLCLLLATVLRIYPILLLPFFAVYALWVEGRISAKPLVSFLAFFMIPLLLIVVSQGYISGSLQAPIDAVLRFPLSQPEVSDIFGFRLGDFFTLTPFLMLLQLYALITFWRKGTALAMVVLAPLLVIFATGTVFGLHFLWASPLLSVYYALDNDLFLFALTFFSGLLSPITSGTLFTFYFGWDLTYQGAQPIIDLLGPCMSGIHYGAKIVYLLKLNLDGLRR